MTVEKRSDAPVWMCGMRNVKLTRLALAFGVLALAAACQEPGPVPTTKVDAAADRPDGGTGAPEAATVDAATVDAGADADSGRVRPSAGCALSRAGGAAQGSITVSGVQRTFIRVVPTSNPSHVPRPLVFAWHGFTWSASSFRDSLASFETAAADGAVIVYADGLNVTLGTQTGHGWDLAMQGRDVALFDALFDALLAETAQNY